MEGLSNLIKQYLTYKLRQKNHEEIDLLLIRLSKIITFPYEEDKYYALPFNLGEDITPEDTDDFIKDLEEIFKDDSLPYYDKLYLKLIIVFIENYLERGHEDIAVRILGKKRGYKWRDTYFSKVSYFNSLNSEIDLNISLMDKIDYDDNSEFEYLIGKDTLFQEDVDSYDIDWGDWDSKYAQYDYTTKIFWLRKSSSE